MDGSMKLAAAVAIAAISLLPARAPAQDLERSRFIATSDVLSQISMFTYHEDRKSDLVLRATPVISTGEGAVDVEYANGNARIAAPGQENAVPVVARPLYDLCAVGVDAGRSCREQGRGDRLRGRQRLDWRHSTRHRSSR